MSQFEHQPTIDARGGAGSTSSRRRSRTASRVAVAAAALVACTVGGAVPAFAVAPETGSIVIEVASDDGVAPLDGWTYSISSDTCEAPPTTATSDADGVATFVDLPRLAADGSPCLYDVVEEPRDGFETLSSPDALLGLQVDATTTPATSGVVLTGADGVFSDPTRRPEPNGNTLPISCLVGEDTAEMRAGRNPFTDDCSLAQEDQSGLGFAGTPGADELPFGTVQVATLTHFNQTIERGFHGASLAVALTLQDAATGEQIVVDASYLIDIDETPDTQRPCPYPGPNGGLPFGFGCADRLTITQPEPVQVELGDALVDVRLAFGSLTDGVCGEPVDVVFTREQLDTTFCLLATVEPIEEAVPTVVSVTHAAVAPTPEPSEPVEPSEPAPSGPAPSEPGASPPVHAGQPGDTLPETGAESAPPTLLGLAMVLVLSGALLLGANARRLVPHRARR